MAASMRAARLHEPGQPLRIDTVDIPEPRPRDVLVQVKACGVIPNMNAIFSGRLWNHLPPLPASVGLDAAGVIAKVGSEVTDVAVGDRVYVNPWLSCGMCALLSHRRADAVQRGRLPGLFRFFPALDPPADGLSVRRLLRVHDGVAAAARAVAAAGDVRPGRALRLSRDVVCGVALLRQVGGGSWVAINGITGTLGVGATLLALGLGATRILGFGRNRDVLAQLKALAPDRIEVLALGDRSIADWMRQRTDGLGVDVLVDCSARSAVAATTADALTALKRGGIAVNIGALTEPLAIQPIRFMTTRLQFRGSNWFTTGEGQLMAEMARVGVLDLTKLVDARLSARAGQ